MTKCLDLRSYIYFLMIGKRLVIPPLLSSLVNLVLFIALIPAVIYAGARPLFCTRHTGFLETYQSLPTVSVLPNPANQWDDLSLYLLFLEENISELKSYKYIKVLCVCVRALLTPAVVLSDRKL